MLPAAELGFWAGTPRHDGLPRGTGLHRDGPWAQGLQPTAALGRPGPLLKDGSSRRWGPQGTAAQLPTQHPAAHHHHEELNPFPLLCLPSKPELKLKRMTKRSSHRASSASTLLWLRCGVPADTRPGLRRCSRQRETRLRSGEI